jgi:hypothetical protein
VDRHLPRGWLLQLTWLGLGQLFSEWVNNPDAQSASDLVAAYEEADTPGDDNGLAGYLALQCTDNQWPPRPRASRQLAV